MQFRSFAHRLLGAVITMTACFAAPTAWGQADSCAADINGDGIVAGDDLASVLGSWGPCSGCAADIVADQFVDGVDLAFILSRWGVTCPPTVSSVLPSSGPVSGGSTVTISGDRLAGVTEVRFAGVPASGVTVLDRHTLLVIVPAGKPGPVAVDIIALGGSLQLNAGFYYGPIVPSWGQLIEAMPEPGVVTDVSLREAILVTGYAWHIRDRETGIEMRLIPPGTFEMGCSASTIYGCASAEFPRHQVTLDSAFYLGRYETTQAQWVAAMGTNPSRFQANGGFPDSATRPVEQVSWHMAQDFLAAVQMRLPTEAEWEYACRAGTSTAFHGWPALPGGTNNDTLIDTIGWRWTGSCSGGAQCQTNPVGMKPPNGFGLHDMCGNVWEWTNDWWSETYYTISPNLNPTGPSQGTDRVVRGGSWFITSGATLRTSDRRNFTPSQHYDGTVGFRVARNP
jgi:formylglycine-generating enzyme required for sulfatase activity